MSTVPAPALGRDRPALRRPVKVLFLHPFAQEGGSENVLLRLIATLDSRFEATVVLMNHGPLEDEVRDLGTPCHVVPLPGKRSVPRFPFAARALAQRLGGDFDVIHANGTKAALFGGYVARQIDLPMLWMKHGHDWDWLAPRVIGPSSDRIICVSSAVAAAFPAWLQDRVAVCHPGVRLPRTSPAAETDPLILAVGRIDPLKGPANLILALALLRDRGVDARLAIAGPADPKAPRHRAELTDLIAQFGLERRAEVLGWVPDIDALYASSRVVALASRKPRSDRGVEGTPLVLLEGMSHARPVVAPNDGGIAEIVGDAGTLIGEARPDELAEALEPYLLDRSLAQEVGARGRRRVEAEFRLEQMTERLAGEYEGLAAREHLAAPQVREEDHQPREFGQSKRIARNTIARSVGEVVAKLASIAFYVVMARELGGEDFGNFIFGLSLSSIVLIAAGFGMDQYLARELAKDRSQLDRLLSNVLLLKAMMLFALMGVLAGIVLLGPYSAETRIAVLLVGLGVGIEMLTQTLHGVTQAYERMELGALGLVLQRLATSIVGIAILLSGGGLIPATVVFVGGSVFGYLVSDLLLRTRVVRPHLAPDRSQWLELLKAGAPIGAASLMFTVLLRLDAALISFLTGGDQVQVGHYGAAYRLVDATMFIGVSFSAAMLPWLARQGERDRALLARGSVIGLKLLAAVLMPVGVAYIVFAPELIGLLYGADFEDAVLPLRFLGAMTVLYGINWYSSSLLIARHRPGAFARGIAAVLVANVILNLALIPLYGASGAAAAAVASGIALAVYSVRQVWVTVGRFTVTRAFAGPAIASAALATVQLLLHLPLWPALVLCGVTYLAVLLAIEHTFYPDDYDLVRGMASGGVGPGPGDSQAQPDDSL